MAQVTTKKLYEAEIAAVKARGYWKHFIFDLEVVDDFRPRADLIIVGGVATLFFAESDGNKVVMSNYIGKTGLQMFKENYKRISDVFASLPQWKNLLSTLDSCLENLHA